MVPEFLTNLCSDTAGIVSMTKRRQESKEKKLITSINASWKEKKVRSEVSTKISVCKYNTKRQELEP